MKDYVVLDLENPNSQCNSICALSIKVVRDNIVVNDYYTLVNPEDRFDGINIAITGIKPADVENAPTLPEIWDDVKALIDGQIIVGHNIAYDLSVISKALIRYGIEEPYFTYCCTLRLSKKNIDADSYKLTDLANSINVFYDAHNAKEDTRATYLLFEHIKKEYGVTYDDIREYSYSKKTQKKDTDQRLVSNLNELKGIIDGILIDDVVVEKEVERIQKWIDENSVHRNYDIFEYLISKLNLIIEDGKVDEYEKIELRQLLGNSFNCCLYNNKTLALQVLKGLMDGIISDGVITDQEVLYLKKWMDEHSLLEGEYPFDSIYKLLNDILEDGVIEESEKDSLMSSINVLLAPVTNSKTNDTTFEISGKQFCLTGEFSCGERSIVKNKLVELGGIEKSGVSSKLDYLFVGGQGSDAWKFGNVGGKIAKAMELKEKGKNICIMSEDELMQYITI